MRNLKEVCDQIIELEERLERLRKMEDHLGLVSALKGEEPLVFVITGVDKGLDGVDLTVRYGVRGAHRDYHSVETVTVPEDELAELILKHLKPPEMVKE